MAAPTGSIRTSSSKISYFSLQGFERSGKAAGDSCGSIAGGPGVFNHLKSFKHSPVLQSGFVAVQAIKETGDRFCEIILTLGDGTSPLES
ncbi:hypothetical protein OPV22_012219 [Ensete ventricosum]|uniref:Copine C-terminal domain-containing protein n=1 Tax=Ensete ventricosum TaxID=4639 RepID=A0AAV8R4E3_ENSVE|nr:hypothetical protein OPV22_012219 [Ensete ventricosum]